VLDVRDFTDAQLRAYVGRLFKVADKNDDGVLSPGELRSLLRLSGFAIDQQQIDKMLFKMDSNGDGDVDLDEFAPAVVELLSKPPQTGFASNASGLIEAALEEIGSFRESLVEALQAEEGVAFLRAKSSALDLRCGVPLISQAWTIALAKDGSASHGADWLQISRDTEEAWELTQKMIELPLPEGRLQQEGAEALNEKLHDLAEIFETKGRAAASVSTHQLLLDKLGRLGGDVRSFHSMVYYLASLGHHHNFLIEEGLSTLLDDPLPPPQPCHVTHWLTLKRRRELRELEGQRRLAWEEACRLMAVVITVFAPPDPEPEPPPPPVVPFTCDLEALFRQEHRALHKIIKGAGHPEGSQVYKEYKLRQKEAGGSSSVRHGVDIWQKSRHRRTEAPSRSATQPERTLEMPRLNL